MDSNISVARRLHLALLAGASLALGWAALSVLFGTSTAQASETAPPQDPAHGSSLLSTVTGTVADVVAPVENVVTQTVGTVTDLVAPSPADTAAPNPVPEESAPSPVPDTAVSDAGAVAADAGAAVSSTAPAAAPVVASVADAASAVTTQVVHTVVDPVIDGLQAHPVTAVTAPVIDTTRGLPVVGGVLDGLGILPLLSTTTGGVDEIVGTVGGTVGAVIGGTTSVLSPPIVPITPLVPTAPAGDQGTDPPSATSPRGTTLPTLSMGYLAATGTSSAAEGAATGSHPNVPSPRTSGGAGSPTGPSGPQPWNQGREDVGTAGASNASAGSSPLFFVATRSASGPSLAPGVSAGVHDDDLPSSPVFGTDVSPD